MQALKEQGGGVMGGWLIEFPLALESALKSRSRVICEISIKSKALIT